MSGSNSTPLGTAATMRDLYSSAKAAVVTGGFKLGMMMARPN